MVVEERIQQHIQRLPVSLQAEVLDFVEYLVAKAERQEKAEWSTLSVAFAMRGMEDETEAVYTTVDLKDVFA
jgi:hypothetical protein